MRAAALAACLFAGPVQAASLEVLVEGIEPGIGRVFVAVCQGGLSGQACRIGDDARADDGSRVFTFGDVPSGVWAVAAFQDLNRNGRLDRTPLGLPLEPYGLSGNVGRRARPDFESASFALREPGAAIRVRLSRALPAR